jgi:hypothetical protein
MLVDEMPDTDLPQWRHKVKVNTVAVLKLDDGECVTAEILQFNDCGEIIVDVVSSHHPDPNSGQHRRAIRIGRIVSCEPQSRADQPWPYSDPCRDRSFSLARFLLLATLVLGLMPGSLLLFILLMERPRPYGLQEASVIVYTIFAIFYTFAATRGLCPYRFTCPAVRSQVSRLLWRHLGFLVALVALQTAALAVRPNLPDWWNTTSGHGRHSGPPFEITLLYLCGGLVFTQVVTNWFLLDRAHQKLSA